MQNLGIQVVVSRQKQLLCPFGVCTNAPRGDWPARAARSKRRISLNLTTPAESELLIRQNLTAIDSLASYCHRRTMVSACFDQPSDFCAYISNGTFRTSTLDLRNHPHIHLSHCAHIAPTQYKLCNTSILTSSGACQDVGHPARQPHAGLEGPNSHNALQQRSRCCDERACASPHWDCGASHIWR